MIIAPVNATIAKGPLSPVDLSLSLFLFLF